MFSALAELSRTEFFPRKHEVSILTAALEGPPKLHVLIGPPSCGKTALVRHVVSQKGEDNDPRFYPLTLNLRGVDVLDLDAFKRAIVKSVAEPVFPKLSGKREVVHPWPRTETKVQSFSEILDWMTKRLSPSTLRGKQPVVLVIDEANELRTLTRDCSNEVYALLRFLVKATKEESLLHVVFTASDSLFGEWLSHHGVPLPDFRTWVLGDLPLPSAHEYYLTQIKSLPLHLHHHFHTDMEGFRDRVFHLTGGRMVFIRGYVQQVCETGPILDAEDFEPIAMAKSHLQRELSPEGYMRYTRSDLLSVFAQLLRSPGNFIPYNDLESQLAGPEGDRS
ncbi:hypothetical protein HK102_013537, partial [Quaeritorhiza haematococci]